MKKLNNSPLKFLTKIRARIVPPSYSLAEILLLLLPLVLFFSYHPVIPLGATESMNLELSLPILWLVFFFFANLKKIQILLLRANNDRKILAIFTLSIFYLFFSALFSLNFFRGILTFGLFTLVIVDGFFAYQTLKNTPKLRLQLIWVLIYSGVFISIFSWFQSLLDILGLPRQQTLMCQGCTYLSFGFPHPNAFAIEPQFLGNLLLAPIFSAFFLLFQNSQSKNQTRLTVSALILLTALFFTFSRGAILSFGLVIAILLPALLIKKILKPIRVLKLSSLIILGLGFSFLLQGIFAELGPTSDSFLTAITKSIHHLSLGRVDLRPKVENSNSNRSEIINHPPSENSKVSSPAPAFSGYVEDSTTIRLDFSRYAFSTWSSNPRYLMFGSGLGSAGRAIYQQHPEIGSPKEIVQNQYFSSLLELGLIGLLLAVLFFFFILLKILPQKSFPRLLWLALLFSFLLSLNFFSGLPNALHIYLLLPLLAFSFNSLPNTKRS